MTLLDARGVSLAGRLEPTDLSCGAGEMVAIIGPNGAGKTSLLRALAGIELDTGSVTIAGESLAEAPPARRMRLLSFLPATRSLVWPIAACDLIALGLPSPDPSRIEQLVDLLELGTLADRPVNSLSTGERCRVLLARALAARPKLLLLDEPLSNLDPYWVLKCLQILRGEASEYGCAVVASLHDLSQISGFDRALLVDHGRTVADRPPNEVLELTALSQAFRIEKTAVGWRIAPEIKRRGDRRSLP